ncbi:hypothetical protein Btru_006204 [Bulinus truncatus]|nr:hypothetical protein Btru_006204 [Bulinus truncatus]
MEHVIFVSIHVIFVGIHVIFVSIHVIFEGIHVISVSIHVIFVSIHVIFVSIHVIFVSIHVIFVTLTQQYTRTRSNESLEPDREDNGPSYLVTIKRTYVTLHRHNEDILSGNPSCCGFTNYEVRGILQGRVSHTFALGRLCRRSSTTQLKSNNDVFVTIQLGKEKYQTSTIKNALNPEWFEECDLPIPNLHSEIEVSVFHHGVLSDDFLGYLSIPLWEQKVTESPKSR